MKQCPTCKQVYTDETLNFCLDDGQWLISQSFENEPATAMIPPQGVVRSSAVGNESPTIPRVVTNDEASIQPSEVSRTSQRGNFNKNSSARAIITALLLLALAGIGYGIYRFVYRSGETGFSLESAKFTRLTTTGKASAVAVSPDGKYVVYVQDEGGQQSLWIRQTATSSNVQLVAPVEAVFGGMAFSPNGSYVYYTVVEKVDRKGTLYQIASLGGTSKKLLTGIHSPVTFSPDGRRIAFFRRATSENGRDEALVTAKEDGTDERVLATRSGDERFSRGNYGGPSWSPDGKAIACPLGNLVENTMTVGVVSAETGETKRVTEQNWFIVRGVFWSANGVDILLNGNPTSFSENQIWQVSSTTGEVRRVTNDLIDYRHISLTADASALAAVQGSATQNVWIMPPNNSARAVQVTQGSGINTEVGWTADGGLLYRSNAAGGSDIFSIHPLKGGPSKQLTSDKSNGLYPQATPDGRYIVFVSDRTGRPAIWRMETDGTDQKQLTDGYDLFPSVTPDSRWIVYQSLVRGRNRVRKVSIEGGQPADVTEFLSGTPDVSPDGKFIVCSYQETRASPLQMIVIPFEGGSALKTFPLPSQAESSVNLLRWTADGQNIVFARLTNGVSNLWAQPLNGGEPKQITDFTADRIGWFDFSPDGKQLALARGTQTGDVVLISNLK